MTDEVGMSELVDTPTASVLTPPGRGAVASLRVRGNLSHLAAAIDSHFTAANGTPLSEQSVGRICFGQWSDPEGPSAETEDVVFCRCDDTTAEIHCHGGPAATERILTDLKRSGIRTVSWQEQAASVSTSLESELDAVLTRATTRRAAFLLLEQQSVLPDVFQELANHPVESAQQKNDLIETLNRLLSWSSFGTHLTVPWRVALVGRPNVGKSTLLNTLAGFTRAIVYDQPGTTRDVVSVETAFDGWPVLLLDTAGIRDTTDEIEREGVSRSRQTIDRADCICLLFDSCTDLSDEDRQLLSEVKSAEASAIIVATRSDLAKQGDLEQSWIRNHPAVVTSAETKDGMDELIEVIVNTLVPNEPSRGEPFPVTARQIDLLQAARDALEKGEAEEAQRFLLSVSSP